MVDCKDQAEVDELRQKLSDGGEEGQCGWLTEKFGVSWQIVPSILNKLFQGENINKAKNVMQAMLQMNKLDIARLKQAYPQG